MSTRKVHHYTAYDWQDAHDPGKACGGCYCREGTRDDETIYHEIVYCPPHAAAPEMLALLRNFAYDAKIERDMPLTSQKARALLAKVEG